MLYKKNNMPFLSDELFKAPTAEYRGTPFWAWNCKLNEKELLRQIDDMKEMGFGGFHIHCRSGLTTEYLGDDYMKLVKSCVKKAKKENMLVWLYDEDRWPSGFAGGLVTKDKKYRQRVLVFSPDPPAPDKYIWLKGDVLVKGLHIDYGRFDIVLNGNGELLKYSRLRENDIPEGKAYYAYVAISEPTPRFNNQTYVDTLNSEAIKNFIEVTYESYKKSVGKDFGEVIPAIFTDEPQFASKVCPSFANSDDNIKLPWTDDLEESFVAVITPTYVNALRMLLRINAARGVMNTE